MSRWCAPVCLVAVLEDVTAELADNLCTCRFGVEPCAAVAAVEEVFCTAC